MDEIINGGFWDVGAAFAPAEGLDNLLQIIGRAQRLEGITVGADQGGFSQIAEIAEQLRTVPGYADTARAKLKELNDTEVSQGVVDLGTALDKIAERIQGADLYLADLGDTSAVDAAKDAVTALFDEVTASASASMISGEQLAELVTLKENLEKGTTSAQDTLSALNALEDANPNLTGFIEKMGGLIGSLMAVTDAAREAAAAVSGIAGGTANTQRAADLQVFRGADADSMASLDTLNSNNDKLLAEATRRADLSKEAAALEDEVKKVRDAASKAGGYLSAEQGLAIARLNLNGKESRKGEGKDNAYEKEAADILKREAALKAETAAQAELNPLINDYGFALEKAKATQDLLAAAEKAGLAITPELKTSIDALAAGYANATVAAAELSEAQDNAKQSMLDWFDLGKSATRGFIDDLVEGKSAAEALGNAFGQLGNKLMDMGLDALFGTGQGANPFGFIGQAFGFAKGGVAANGRPKMFAKGGVSDTAAVFGEAGPEAAVPLPDGRRIPVDLRMPNAGSSGGGTTTVPININIDATGADAAGLARVEQRLAELKAGLPGQIRHVVSRRNKDLW